MSQKPMDEELQELISVKAENPISNNVQTRTNVSLLRLVLDNNLQQLEEALLLDTSEDLFKAKHNLYDSRNIITIACVNPAISQEVFRTVTEHVYRRFPYIDLQEEKWYYWEPLHFAAYYINWGKLKIIVSNLNKRKVNALSIFSENALHVLLEYGKRIESFNVQMSNGWETKVCHVIAQEKIDLVKCAKVLVDAGVDINHNNIWNETPLMLAIKYRLVKVTKLLLRKKEVDLDTCRDSKSGKSAREMLRANDMCLDVLPPSILVVDIPTKSLFTLLKSNNEELFLRYNNDNIRQYANNIDGDNAFNTSGTLLQLCLIKGYIEYQKEKRKSYTNEKDIMKSTMLKVFCQKGYVKSIEHLLSNDVDVTVRNRIFQYSTVFETAVKLNYYPFLTMLLEHRTNKIKTEDILNILSKINEATFEPKNHHFRHVLYLLISKLESLVDQADYVTYNIDYNKRSILNNILDLYLKHNQAKNEYGENICQVLRLGASLVDADLSKLGLVSYDALNFHLDQCIDKNNDVNYNSLILDDGERYSETSALHYLSHDPKKSDLLNHPALIYLIHSKWLQSNKFFYVDLFFYTAFLLTLYFYMVYLHIGNVSPILFYTFLVNLGIHTLKELTQLLLYGWRYFLDVTNYIETPVIIACYVNVFSKNEVFMVIAILLSTVIFILMLGQLPMFTKYMIIFSSTKYFFEYAMFYFIQFVSFALCFFILLPSDETNQNSTLKEIFKKLFESLIFFIGQFDGDVANPPKFPIFGRIVVGIFIFCMTIILNNLLVGLIVTDMDIIQKTGKLLRQVKMVKYIVRIEMFLKRIEQYSCCKPLKILIRNTRVFRKGTEKHLNLTLLCGAIFDDEDKARLKKSLEDQHVNRSKHRNALKSLYDHIMTEAYSDHRNHKGNRDILLKLAQLEEQLHKIKV